MKYKLLLKYDGSNYYGWNKQPQFPTIASALEKAFKQISDEKVKIQVASRTDRFVHARRQICTFETNYLSINLAKFKKKLNQKLSAIKIIKIEIVSNDFNPRRMIKEKTYLYKIYQSPNRWKKKKENYQYNYFWKINYKLLKEDAKFFLGYKNFASFTSKTHYQNYFRTINKIKIYRHWRYLYIEISGDAFMRYMVRNIVGALLAKNRQKYSLEEFKELFEKPKKGKVNYKVPGSGLYLKRLKVKNEDLIID